MTQARWFVALAAAATICLAMPSHAQVARKIESLYTGAATDTTAVGMADSTRWFSTERFQRGYIYLKPNKPCRVAIAIYEGGASDTAMIVSGEFHPDTVSTSVWDWHGSSWFTPSGVDSTVFNETIAPTSDAPASYELIKTFPAGAASKWGAPRGRWIALRASDGGWFWGMRCRIRLRVLSASGVVTWTARYKGISW